MGDYTKLFDPTIEPFPSAGANPARMGDRSQVEYIYDDTVVLAVNTAMATARPLLIRGASGLGKSALARDVARRKGWHFTEIQMTSRTEAQDLLYQFDALRRLQDAQAGAIRDDAAYFVPGPLWEAFDPDSSAAQRRRAFGPVGEVHQAGGENTVVLVDEIDKADPDLPNNLLAVLGNLAFKVDRLGINVLARSVPFIAITTNDERDLPPAFLRRCIELNLQRPDKAALRRIAMVHFPNITATLLDQALDKLEEEARRSGIPLNTAEFLDLLLACQRLGIAVGSSAWTKVMAATLAKPQGREMSGR